MRDEWERLDWLDERWFEVRSSRVTELRTQNFELHVAPVLLVSLTIQERRGPDAVGRTEAAIQTELVLVYLSGPLLVQGWLCACQKLEPQLEADRL
jgi:hypothetical protein